MLYKSKEVYDQRLALKREEMNAQYAKFQTNKPEINKIKVYQREEWDRAKNKKATIPTYEELNKHLDTYKKVEFQLDQYEVLTSSK